LRNQRCRIAHRQHRTAPRAGAAYSAGVCP
jgi:hypothetical protein